MNWLFPGFLVGAAAIGLPILLHLLRRRPKRTVVFPSLRFLALTQPRTDRHQRLRRWIVLVLRCAALALLAAAFARPFFGRRQGAEQRATVVVVDNSFSLQAGLRWPTLQKWVSEKIGTPAPHDTLGILVMAPRPRWLAPPSSDAVSAKALLEKLKPGWESTRVEPALRLAADAVAALPADRREVVYLGDHQRVSWTGFNFAKKLREGVGAVFPDLPEPIKRQAAMRAPVVSRTPEGFRASVPIQNYTAPQTRTLRVYRDNAPAPIHQQVVVLAERESQTVQIDLPVAAKVESVHFRFALDEDDLTADDQAYAVWQSAGERTILLDASPAGTSADFVTSALASTSDLKPAFEIVTTSSTVWPVRAVAILRNDASFAGDSATRLEGFLRTGGSALVFATGGPAQVTWLASSHNIKLRALKSDRGPLQVRDWAMDHPLVTAMSSHSVKALLGWEFQRGWALPPDAVDPLALWSDRSAAMGETAAGVGRMLLCGFMPDRRDSEWPVREMFVPFVHRAVAYLLGVQESGVVKPAIVGQAITLPAEAGSWRALDGSDATAAVMSVGSAVTPAAPGVYEFRSGGARRLFAVNLSSEESDPVLWSEGAPWRELSSSHAGPASLPAQISLAAIEAEQRSSLWWWLLVAMAILALAELGVANRTTR